MADFSTLNVTADAEPDPSLTSSGFSLRQGLSFVKQMKAHTTPTTPALGGGSGGPRPTMGLIFPRGMG